MLRPPCFKHWHHLPRRALFGVIISLWVAPLALANDNEAIADPDAVDAVKETVTPITSPYDSRDYRVLTLENGLKRMEADFDSALIIPANDAVCLTSAPMGQISGIA